MIFFSIVNADKIDVSSITAVTDTWSLDLFAVSDECPARVAFHVSCLAVLESLAAQILEAVAKQRNPPQPDPEAIDLESLPPSDTPTTDRVAVVPELAGAAS